MVSILTPSFCCALFLKSFIANNILYCVCPQVGSVTDYASGLVVNRLGVSTDVLLPQSCSGPPKQITPTTSGKLPQGKTNSILKTYML